MRVRVWVYENKKGKDKKKKKELEFFKSEENFLVLVIDNADRSCGSSGVLECILGTT